MKTAALYVSGRFMLSALFLWLLLSACAVRIGADDVFLGTTRTEFTALTVNGKVLGPLTRAEGVEVAKRYAGKDRLWFGQFLDEPNDVVAVIKTPAPGRFELRAGEHRPNQRNLVGRANSRSIGIRMTQIDAAPGEPVIAYCGGNTFSLPLNGTFAFAKLRSFGHVIAFEYPGYGFRAEEETSAATMGAFASEVAALLDEGLSDYPGPLVLWGHSLGSVVCADIAARASSVDAVVLEAPVRNAQATIRAWTPWWARPFVRVQVEDGLANYDAVEALTDFTGPVLVLGASRDQVLPPHLARKLAADLEAVGVETTYAEFPKAQHVDIASAPGFNTAIRGFLSEASR